MAKELSRFWDYTEENGNEYQADDFAEYFRSFFADGVPKLGTNLQVTASSTGMLINVDYGAAMVQGSGYWLKDEGSGVKTLPITAAHASFVRIDRVVLRRDKSISVAGVKLIVLTGDPAANPSPPDLMREGNIYDLSLAQVRVEPGVLSISADKVTDERPNNDLCGLCENKVTRDRIDAVVAALAGKANTNHNQAMDTINGLAEALAGKSDTSHTQEVETITGLQTELDKKLNSSSYTAADVLTKIKSVDGSGSGLDADLLDGHDTAYFQTSLPAENRRKITISTSNPSGGVDGDIWIKVN